MFSRDSTLINKNSQAKKIPHFHSSCVNFCAIGVNLLLLCMISYIRAIVFAFLLVLVGCTKNEFTLNFNLSEDVSDNYDVAYFAADAEGGYLVQTAASVMKGQAFLKGVTISPTLIYIVNRRSKVPLVIYADKGEKITIEGESSDPLEWKVEGNEINATLSAWREENADELKKDDSSVINKDIEDFVSENPDSPAGLILLETYFDKRLDYFRYMSLLQHYSGMYHKEQWLGRMPEVENMGAPLAYPASIQSMVMRASHGGTDTIMFSRHTPGFLMFWQNDIKNKKALIDSLRKLVKEFPDSTKRYIADINLDHDSTTWRSAIKKDTLSKELRLWAPAGLADEAVMKLRVGGVPYFIVLDSAGHQTYRGIEVEEAMNEFRTLLKNKETNKKR